MLPPVNDGDLALDIHDLGIVPRDFINDLLRALTDEVLVMVHHYDLGLGDALDIFDLKMVHQEFFVISLCQDDHD